MVKSYTPERGDIVWVNFDPVLGHEQAGKRPALVLSPKAYHERASLLIACPITTRIKGYPFEVLISVGSIKGVILADQVKTIDWRKRKIGFATKAPNEIVQETITKLTALFTG